MKIRTARLEEIPEIMKIYDTARRFMQEHENPTQWKAGYPSRELVEREKQATIVTNMLEVVSILADSSLPVIFIGGEFDYGRDGFVGSLAMEQIMKFRFDISFLGVVGIDVHDNSVYTYMANDGATKRAILSSSKQAFMVCESDKFMQIGNYRYAGADEFTGIITDHKLDRENEKLMKNMQLCIQLAE